MKRIYKYELSKPTVRMPQGAEVLTVQIQAGHLCAWALVDDAAPLVDRVFEIIGTGHAIANDGEEYPGEYLGTVQDGPFVWHIFEREEAA